MLFGGIIMMIATVHNKDEYIISDLFQKEILYFCVNILNWEVSES
jgi:hypothetical protein